MNNVLRERLSTLYAAMKLGQLDFVLNAIDDDIEFISYAPIKVFPFLGHRRGKAAMSEALHGAGGDQPSLRLRQSARERGERDIDLSNDDDEDEREGEQRRDRDLIR